jgi:hypothetical protein
MDKHSMIKKPQPDGVVDIHKVTQVTQDSMEQSESNEEVISDQTIMLGERGSQGFKELNISDISHLLSNNSLVQNTPINIETTTLIPKIVLLTSNIKDMVDKIRNLLDLW